MRHIKIDPIFNELKDRVFVKDYRFLFFAKNIGKNISRSLSSKYSLKRLDYAK